MKAEGNNICAIYACDVDGTQTGGFSLHISYFLSIPKSLVGYGRIVGLGSGGSESVSHETEPSQRESCKVMPCWFILTTRSS